MIEYIIDEEYSGLRVDRYLRKKLVNIHLSEIYKMIRKGKIKINEKKIKQDTRLNLGDKLQVYINLRIDEESKKENFIPLSNDRKEALKSMIVYENENLFIVNKNSGEIVHRGSGHNISLLEEYRAFYKNSSVNFVNRIDKATSGLVIAAKNIKTARKLAEYIRERRIEKKYYILVNGFIEEKYFEIKSFLKKEAEEILISDTPKENYKESLSYFKKIASSNRYSLLEADLKTGRTHQLRVQLADINHSIVGDKKYGISDGEDIMYLFSYYLNIPEENIEIKLEIPKIFKNKLNK